MMMTMTTTLMEPAIMDLPKGPNCLCVSVAHNANQQTFIIKMKATQKQQKQNECEKKNNKIIEKNFCARKKHVHRAYVHCEWKG